MRDPTEVDPDIITEQDTVVALEEDCYWLKECRFSKHSYLVSYQFVLFPPFVFFLTARNPNKS